LLQPKILPQQPNVLLIEPKHFVVVTKYFCYPYFKKSFCWYNKTFFFRACVLFVKTGTKRQKLRSQWHHKQIVEPKAKITRLISREKHGE